LIQIWKTYRKLATPAFNSSLSPDMVGETTMELFSFMKKNLNLNEQPIDVFTLFQRITIEILGKMAFGHQFGVSSFILLISFYCYISGGG
jgi:cytochrome P450